MAEEAAGDHDGMVEPGRRGAGAAEPRLDDVVASVARGSMDVLSRNVRDLFTRYVAEVAGGSATADDGEPAVDAETAVLLHAVDRRPDRAVLPGGVGRAADHRGPAGAAGRVGDPAPAGGGVPAAAPRAHPAADAGRGAGAAAAVRRTDDGQLSSGRHVPGRTRRRRASAAAASARSAAAERRIGRPAEVVAADGDHRHEVGQQRAERRQRQRRERPEASATW